MLSTAIADRQIAGLRGARRKAYDVFEKALILEGCAALGYRLTGDAPLPSLCVKHLRGHDRAVVTFSGDRAWVLLVGAHAEGVAAEDIYTALYELAPCVTGAPVIQAKRWAHSPYGLALNLHETQSRPSIMP